jgi:hypothetical protein
MRARRHSGHFRVGAGACAVAAAVVSARQCRTEAPHKNRKRRGKSERRTTNTAPQQALRTSQELTSPNEIHPLYDQSQRWEQPQRQWPSHHSSAKTKVTKKITRHAQWNCFKTAHPVKMPTTHELDTVLTVSWGNARQSILSRIATKTAKNRSLCCDSCVICWCGVSAAWCRCVCVCVLFVYVTFTPCACHRARASAAARESSSDATDLQDCFARGSDTAASAVTSADCSVRLLFGAPFLHYLIQSPERLHRPTIVLR